MIEPPPFVFTPFATQFLLRRTKPKLILTIFILTLSFQLLTLSSFAQYTKLHEFDIGPDGSSPWGNLISDGTFLYGMTQGGGTNGNGTLFRMKPDGTGHTIMLNFSSATTGSFPQGSLISDGTFLYGMTTQGGTNNIGTVFKIKPDGTNYSKLLDFAGIANGSTPYYGSLISDGTFLYGMTTLGGTNNFGTVFKVRVDGTGYGKLVDFVGATNGTAPNGSLISDGTFLYGMTELGGTSNAGTIFKILPDGTGYVKLLDFDNTTNGATPVGDFIFDGTFLYGMTAQGGTNSLGTIFKILPDGTGYTKLFDFSDGRYPYGNLVSDGVFLYGMTLQGGINGFGTIFKIMPDGSGFAKLLDFDDSFNGRFPYGSLLLDGSFLYGMTREGGTNEMGTIFKYALTPTITSFTPTMGVEGTFVTINGTNFDPTLGNNVVKFNNVTAIVKSGTATSLVAVVPLGATTGPISVTAGGATGTSSSDFTVTTNPPMSSSTVISCNSQFTAPPGSSTIVETFMPVNPADKIQVSFSSFSVPSDVLKVYDGPTSSSPLIISLSGNSLPADIVATGSGGELTFKFIWGDGTSSNWQAIISCQSTGPTISIDTEPSDFTACAGDIATFTTAASGTTNITYQWQYSSDGIVPFSDISNGVNYSNVATPELSVNTAGGFGAGRYRCKIGGDLASTVFTDDEGLFINPLPATPTISNVTNCGPGSVMLTASGGTDGNYLWYDVSGLISGQANSTYTTPVISSNATYSVAVTDGLCISTKVDANAIINNIPSAPGTLDASNCGAGSVTLSASGGSNGNYLWYDTNGLISGQTNSTYVTPIVASTTIYSVAITNGTCVSPKVNVNAIINNIPAAPGKLDASNCGASSVTLSASGGSNGNYLWYDSNGLISGQTNSTYVTPIVASTTIYSVAITNGTCTSPQTNVTAIINVIPAAPGKLDASNCGASSVTLSASGGSNGNYLWYDSNGLISGQTNSTYVTPIVASTTIYSVAITNGTCTSPQTNVTAIINVIPTAPTTQGASQCAGSTFLLTGFGGTNGTYIWYTTASGGSAILGEVNSTYVTPALTGNTTYYVSIHNSTCESLRTPVTATVITTGCSIPVITTSTLTTQIGGSITLSLIPLINVGSGILDPSSIVVIQQPPSGAVATVTNGVVTVNYNGLNFSGSEQFTIRACDTDGNCATQVFTIQVTGDIVVYNGISPNGKNPTFIIEYINLLQDTKENSVYIFDRWENQVWHGTNYDNTAVVFTGASDGGSDLPSGVYFYKIDFSSGRKTQTGFLSLRRQ